MGTLQLLDVGNILSAAGLMYRWTMAVVYPATWHCRPFKSWNPGYRPVMVFSRDVGKWPLTSDTFTVPAVVKERGKHHAWEQPLQPWVYWVEKLTPAGGTVADPFAGSGTVGVACRQTGRRYIGTGRDEVAYRVAVGRINSPGL